MSATAIAPHVLYAIKCHSKTAQSAGAVWLGQITDQRISDQLMELVESASGMVDATHVSVMTAEPIISFTTTDLAGALDVAGISGMLIDSDAEHPGIVLWLQAMAKGGTRAGASAHIKITIANGMLVPRTISAQQGPPPARVTMDILPISADGSTAPVSIQSSQSLEGTPSVESLWTIGPLTLNGTDAPITDGNLNCGINAIREGGSGQVYSTWVGMMDRRPIITAGTQNAALLASFGTVGLPISGTTSVGFRKMVKGGSRVAYDTAEHILITVAEGRISLRNVGGAHNSRMAGQIQITPSYDGINDVVAIDTAAELPW